MEKRAYIHRSAYDVMYENDWSAKPWVQLYNGGGFKAGTTFPEQMRFAWFMSKMLGFRLRVTFSAGGHFINFRKVG